MAFVRMIAHKVTVLHQGKLLAEGSMDQVQNDRTRHRCLPRPLSARRSCDAERIRPQRVYGDSHVVRDVSFDGRDGETIAIMGRNGMGKTTLLKSLIGLLPAAQRQGRPRRPRTDRRRTAISAWRWAWASCRRDA